MKKRIFSPESLMMSYGYDPRLSEGAIKCPIFQTSTFVFNSAEEGKSFFEVAYGKRQKRENEETGLIYSRINNPDLEILEDRLCLWDEAEACAVFESGMSAISTVLLEFLKPGDVLVHSSPVYGGTDHFIHHFLPKIGIRTMSFKPGETIEQISNRIEKSGYAGSVGMIYIETPANPTNDLIDISHCATVAKSLSTDERKVLLAVDNTYMGPLWQHPLKHGADLVIYSATKYIGGHSDVIAGAVLGYSDLIGKIKTLRTFLGNMAGPWTGWLLMRSLETLKIRMEKQAQNAQAVSVYLARHPKVKRVYFPEFLDKDSEQYRTYERQCLGTGAMLSFDIDGGELEAFQFLNHLSLIKLAVSLGGTESLAEHPFTMTHAGVAEEELVSSGVTPSMIRLSAGVEKAEDLIWDIEQALDKVETISSSRNSVKAAQVAIHG